MVLKIFFLVSEVGLTWADTLRDTIFPPRKVPRVPCGDFSLHTGGRLLTICKQHKNLRKSNIMNFISYLTPIYELLSQQLIPQTTSAYPFDQ